MKVKENKGSALTGVIIALLIILLIGAIGGGIYLLKNPVKECAEGQKVTTMTADEKFAQYAKNVKEAMLKYNEEEIDGKEYREYTIYGIDENEKAYSIILSGDGVLKLNEKEVATNVIGFNVVNIGNGGFSNLYLIKEDGTVAYASIEETEYLSDGKVKITDVPNLKNIISIVGGVSAFYNNPGACFAYAIDIEGNMFEI